MPLLLKRHVAAGRCLRRFLAPPLVDVRGQGVCIVRRPSRAACPDIRRRTSLAVGFCCARPGRSARRTPAGRSSQSLLDLRRSSFARRAQSSSAGSPCSSFVEAVEVGQVGVIPGRQRALGAAQHRLGGPVRIGVVLDPLAEEMPADRSAAAATSITTVATLIENRLGTTGNSRGPWSRRRTLGAGRRAQGQPSDAGTRDCSSLHSKPARAARLASSRAFLAWRAARQVEVSRPGRTITIVRPHGTL